MAPHHQRLCVIVLPPGGCCEPSPIAGIVPAARRHGPLDTLLLHGGRGHRRGPCQEKHAPHGIVNFMPKIATCQQRGRYLIWRFHNPSICAAHTPSNFLKGKVSSCPFRPSCASMFWARQGVQSWSGSPPVALSLLYNFDSTHCRSPLMSPPGHRRRPWRPSQGSTSRKSTQRRHPSPLHDSPPLVIAAQRDRARTMPARLSTRNAFCSSPGRRPGSKDDETRVGLQGLRRLGACPRNILWQINDLYVFQEIRKIPIPSKYAGFLKMAESEITFSRL